MTPLIFRDRVHAGQLLAEALMKYANRDDVIVLGLPRGGVPVAYEVAKQLHVPLDVIVVRKLGVPGYAELAMGAIASGGIQVVNHAVMRSMGRVYFRVRSNSSWMRRYSSYHASGWVKPWRSSGYDASSHLSLRSSIRRCASMTESL